MKEQVSAEVIHRLIPRLLMYLKGTGFRPNVVYGVKRGGLVPAVYLSHALNVPMESLQVSLRHGSVDIDDDDLDKLEELVAQGFNVLIVDDINDSGKTLETISERLGDHDHLKYATIYQRSSSTFRKNWFASLLNDDRWIVFPWEAYGDE